MGQVWQKLFICETYGGLPHLTGWCYMDQLISVKNTWETEWGCDSVFVSICPVMQSGISIQVTNPFQGDSKPNLSTCQTKKGLHDGESNPGLPRDRRGY